MFDNSIAKVDETMSITNNIIWGILIHTLSYMRRYIEAYSYFFSSNWGIGYFSSAFGHASQGSCVFPFSTKKILVLCKLAQKLFSFLFNFFLIQTLCLITKVLLSFFLELSKQLLFISKW